MPWHAQAMVQFGISQALIQMQIRLEKNAYCSKKIIDWFLLRTSVDDKSIEIIRCLVNGLYV